MIPRELQLIAQAVIDGDETAALAMFDALTEVRQKLGTDAAVHDQALEEILREAGGRVRNAVSSLGITSLGEQLATPPDDLLLVREFGERSLARLQAVLASRGFSLRQGPSRHFPPRTADTLPTGEWTPFPDNESFPHRWRRVPRLASRHTLEETARILQVRKGTKEYLDLSRYWAWFSAARRHPESMQGY